jgi:hypothetical protein
MQIPNFWKFQKIYMEKVSAGLEFQLPSLCVYGFYVGNFFLSTDSK